MIFARTILIVAISAKNAKDPHITFIIFPACYLEEVFSANRLDINVLVFKRYSQLIIVLILNWQDKREDDLIACLAANDVFYV